MLIFYAFAVIVVCLGILSLRGGFDFVNYFKRELSREPRQYTPFVSVIAPCRGTEPGLADNLSALFAQQFPNYEIVFVTDSANDAALGVIRETIDRFAGSAIQAQVVVAGEAVDCGQKVHNLRAAIGQIDVRTEVLVFVDSDARPPAAWLKNLVAALADESVGATTGYRWFMADQGGFASHLRSVWNASIASALGSRTDKNFCWGGSTAIRRSTFDAVGIYEAWRGTVSDDFTITRVLQKANLPIYFVPACIIPSFGVCSFSELFEFTNRQLKITRTYAPHLWKSVLIGSLLFSFVFFGGILLTAVRAASGLSIAWPLFFLVIIFVLGLAKSWIRFNAVKMVLGNAGNLSGLLSHLLLWPLASLLFLWNALVAWFSRRIVWRGVTYQLKSATEAVIIRSNSK